MKYVLRTLLFWGSVLYASCKSVPANVYCQGFVVRETTHTADHEQLFATYTLHCNGECPNGIACKKEKTYDPPQANGLVKMEWCGCSDAPNACDIILKTFNINGREIKQADCTEWNTCPVDTDSCIQMLNRSRIDTNLPIIIIDTLFNEDQTIKEIHYRDTLSCDCVSRISGS